MSMKKILMAAVAVSALSAGAASAAKFDITASGTSISTGGTAVYLNNASSATTGVAEAYTLPSELAVDATTNVATTLVIAPTATVIPAGTYLVTWNISGGTFKIATTPTFAGVVAAPSGTNTISGVLSTATATSITALYTVAGTSTVTSFSMTEPVLLGVAKSPVVVSASITTPAGTAIDGGAVAAQTIIDYRAGYKFKATARPATLTLASAFKDFTAGTYATAAAADIATAVGFAVNDNPVASTVSTTDYVFSDGVGSRLTTAPLTGVKLTVVGSTAAFKIRAQNAAASATATADTGTTDQITVTSGGVYTDLLAATATVGLTQKTPTVTGVESAYSVTPSVTVASGGIISAPTFTSKAIGSVSYEGETLYAPWVSDGSNGINYTIRLADTSGAAVGTVRVSLLNPTVTVANPLLCSVGSVGASGELLITSTVLKGCFGSFGRSDVSILVNGTATGVITAKMRAASANNTVVSDVPLGLGVVAAKAQ